MNRELARTCCLHRLVAGGCVLTTSLFFLGCGDRSPVAAPKTTATSNSPLKLGDRVTNSIGMELLYIPPGKFTMGSPESEKDRNDDEYPVDVVLSQGFWLGKHEVTQGEFTKVMGTTPWKGEEYGKEGANFAASYISHDDAAEFCRKLTESERKSGRLGATQAYALPSEAQWEYACRGGEPTAYSFGATDAKLGEFAWSAKNAYGVDEFAHPVGLKKPNPFGLYDMHGNVSEWCRDEYNAHLPGGTNPEVKGPGKKRVLRGGSWAGLSEYCRSAARNPNPPGNRRLNFGFRVSRIP